jgi:hypothetical protein
MAGTSAPTILTVNTSVTPLANVRSYNFVGYFEGATNPSGEKFVSAGVKKTISDRTGVTAPWAQLPMKFKV